MSRKMLVTGSNGLIGSEVVDYFATQGWEVSGIDNNMREDFFGRKSNTRINQLRLVESHSKFRHVELDIRNRNEIGEIVKEIRPDVIVHAAAQPSHDLAASRPFDDFDVNAVGTMNMLEAARQFCPESSFIYFSTNKVYGDGPNNLPLIEKPMRWDYAREENGAGIKECFPIDQATHSLFGASKLAADVMVQEYGRYFDIPTCCLRGGCLTGPNHMGVELHGFLSYLVRCNVSNTKYTVYGYKGKQVRDNIHSKDVVSFCEEFIKAPRCGEVYNLGGGRENSVSILEAFEIVESISGIPMIHEYTEKNRFGDHICYISDLTKIREHYPGWGIEKDLKDIFQEIYNFWRAGET